jgi:pyrimidine-nucleoside phosphorylase
MRPQEIIAKKRDGGELTAEEIGVFIRGVCDASWADYQISALVMAMFIRGLNDVEGETLVREMLYSGEVLDFSDIDRPKADKHSTGGVGDKCSLIIAPVVAACGVAVPMISGRGLGHTGGTLDKLESIPGYNVNLSTHQFREIIQKCGFAMAGQTADIAPADKKLYALRDATATVPYIPLIVASIMSKKLAEGLDALVLDVKTGSGAFMQKQEDAVALAKAMVACGEAAPQPGRGRPVAGSHHDDRLPAERARDVVARPRDLARVAHEDPPAVEDPLHLVLEDRGIGVERGVDAIVLDQVLVVDHGSGSPEIVVRCMRRLWCTVS